jgi:hypothetical protein
VKVGILEAVGRKSEERNVEQAQYSEDKAAEEIEVGVSVARRRL